MLRLFKGQMDSMSMTWMIWDFKLCQIKSSVLGGIRLHLWGWELLLDGEGVLGCRKEGSVQQYNPTGSPHERVTPVTNTWDKILPGLESSAYMVPTRMKSSFLLPFLVRLLS